MSRKIVLYIASSLDGFIATHNHDISFLNAVEKPGEDYGYAQFFETVDTLILGRRTYEKIIEMGYNYPPNKKVYVISHTQNKAPYYNGNLAELVNELKSQNGKTIYCDGGSKLIKALLDLNQIDEIIVSIIPVLLGSGIPLFADRHELVKPLKLLKVNTFDTGLVQMHYAIHNPL